MQSEAKILIELLNINFVADILNEETFSFV